MEDTQGKVFSGFTPPPTTDGSYRGGVKHRKASEEHYKMKFEQELVQVNQRLKAAKARVSIECLGDALQLRATLPLKPDDISKNGKDTKQYKISLGIPANFNGLKTAEEEAYELGRLIARKMFVWSDKYLATQAKKVEQITFAEFYEQLENRYFSKRKRTIKSENSFNGLKRKYKLFFLCDDVITESLIIKKIKLATTPNQIKSAIMIARVFAQELNINFDTSSISFTIEKKKREIPTDNTIQQTFRETISNLDSKNNLKSTDAASHKRIKIIYALLAIYGLRPREIINKPDLDWLVSPENKRNTFKVHESNKTGYREVFPFVPEWVELFDLKNLENLDELKKYIFGIQGCKTLDHKVSTISSFFLRHKFGFKPYDLRHACAIRAHLQGIPIKAAADNLGHSMEEHTKTYQHHFGFENRVKAFENTFESINEVDALKDEIAQLRRRNAELELKIARLKLENTI